MHKKWLRRHVYSVYHLCVPATQQNADKRQFTNVVSNHSNPNVMILFAGVSHALTIQGKCDLKALSSKKIMINKYIDYSHVIREQV